MAQLFADLAVAASDDESQAIIQDIWAWRTKVVRKDARKRRANRAQEKYQKKNKIITGEDSMLHKGTGPIQV